MCKAKLNLSQFNHKDILPLKDNKMLFFLMLCVNMLLLFFLKSTIRKQKLETHINIKKKTL